MINFTFERDLFIFEKAALHILVYSTHILLENITYTFKDTKVMFDKNDRWVDREDWRKSDRERAKSSCLGEREERSRKRELPLGLIWFYKNVTLALGCLCFMLIINCHMGRWQKYHFQICNTSYFQISISFCTIYSFSFVSL